jgi:hypothetical protein
MINSSINSIIDSANSIVILLPTRPYFDQVAAGLSLYLSIKNRKPVTISCPSEMIVEFNRLVGVDKIKKELGSKDLTIKFPNYPADNIERVSADVEDDHFFLRVIPKAGFESPKENQIDITYSGVSGDTIIMVGGANETHFPSLSTGEIDEARLVHIGTKELSISSEREILSFARPAASSSEIVASLIKESGLEIDADISSNLLMGIEDGSNNFESKYVTAETFEMAAFLMRQGGKRSQEDEINKESFPPGSIPGEFDRTKSGKDTPKDWMEPKIFKGDTLS